MKQSALGLFVALVLTSPGAASEWNSYFNMGTFAAAGGDETSGSFNFECAGEESGFASVGRPVIEMSPMAGAAFDKKSLPDVLNLWVDDDMSYLLPIVLDAGSTRHFSYRYSPETVQQVRDLIAAMRKGSMLSVFAGSIDDPVLARMPLDGSYAALEFVEDCIS